MRKAIYGKYAYTGGQFIPDDGMNRILTSRKPMLKLSDTGTCVPTFLYDPSDGSFWKLEEFEDYSARMTPITREEIEKNHPTVECDRRLTVDW